MRIALIASVRHPISPPFAGGLEMHTHLLAQRLRERGHAVTVFASDESDPALDVEALCPASSSLALSEQAASDVSMPPRAFMQEHHAYLHLMLRLAERDFDVVHNNSLHYLPVAMADTLPSACVTTLHTPPTPWLESALAAARQTSSVHFVSVSGTNAAQWSSALPTGRIGVIPNGVELERWTYRAHGDPQRAAWIGRIVPEKGPHLAVEAAHRAGLSIDLAGPSHDRDYFEREVLPRLRPGDRYHGHLRGEELDGLLGGAGVFVCTPCWDEPYGLVVAEALACGTPVAAFDRGAMGELLTEACGALARPGDVDALAEAARHALTLRRSDCRERAESHCSAEVMVSRYEALYERIA
jgi:glycosyltransferase involved in cell wall biosynthesis